MGNCVFSNNEIHFFVVYQIRLKIVWNEMSIQMKFDPTAILCWKVFNQWKPNCFAQMFCCRVFSFANTFSYSACFATANNKSNSTTNSVNGWKNNNNNTNGHHVNIDQVVHFHYCQPTFDWWKPFHDWIDFAHFGWCHLLFSIVVDCCYCSQKAQCRQRYAIKSLSRWIGSLLERSQSVMSINEAGEMISIHAPCSTVHYDSISQAQMYDNLPVPVQPSQYNNIREVNSSQYGGAAFKDDVDTSTFVGIALVNVIFQQKLLTVALLFWATVSKVIHRIPILLLILWKIQNTTTEDFMLEMNKNKYPLVED